jgi:PAS domain-containing protein
MNSTREWQGASVRTFICCGALSRIVALVTLLCLDPLWQELLHAEAPLVHAQSRSFPRLFICAFLALSVLLTLLGSWYRRLSRRLAELTTDMAALRAENEESQRRLVALQESEDRYHSLFEHAYDGMLCLTTEGIITDVNHGQEALSGWSREQLLGCHYASFLTPASRAHVKNRVSRPFTNKKCFALMAAAFSWSHGAALSVTRKESHLGCLSSRATLRIGNR